MESTDCGPACLQMICAFYGKDISQQYIKDGMSIFTLENGMIAEQGIHQQLVDRKGKYYELIKNQLELES